MVDPCTLPAREIAARIKRRELSAHEVLQVHLDRIDALNDTLRAVVSLDVAGARRAAQAADAAVARGDDVGPLHGVPLTLKDGHDVAGLRTTIGTPAMDRVPPEDGTVAARLRAAGAILIGHSNVPPWLADYQSANALFGRALNPWDRERTPGGSSGGAAAALAAGLTPLEVGSDLAGSVRLPAHFCGVYGLKTTEHCVPLSGYYRPPAGVPRAGRIISCIGPMARDLADLELALRIIAGPDGRDGDVPPVPLGVAPDVPLRGLRLAAAATLPGARVAQAVRAQVERVARAAAAAGAEVVERLPQVDWDALNKLFGELTSVITGLFDPAGRLRDEQRTLAFYLDALQRRDGFIAAWHAFFSDVDALILPPAMTTAFRHCETNARIDVDGVPTSYWGHGRLLGPASLAGLPALAVPAGRDEQGLPVGVQLVGPAWSDLRLLAVARALEKEAVLPGFTPPPAMLRETPP